MVKYSYKYLEDLWTEGYWKFICDNEDKIDYLFVVNEHWLSHNISVQSDIKLLE